MMKKDAVENLKLYLAAFESYRTGSLTPILKEELKYRIQSRRLSEGKAEMVVGFGQNESRKQPESLRPDEIDRKNRRKIQNKKAATKFREKRKLEQQQMRETLQKLTQRNTELHGEVNRLESEKKLLESIVLELFKVSDKT